MLAVGGFHHRGYITTFSNFSQSKPPRPFAAFSFVAAGFLAHVNRAAEFNYAARYFLFEKFFYGVFYVKVYNFVVAVYVLLAEFCGKSAVKRIAGSAWANRKASFCNVANKQRYLFAL